MRSLLSHQSLKKKYVHHGHQTIHLSSLSRAFIYPLSRHLPSGYQTPQSSHQRQKISYL